MIPYVLLEPEKELTWLNVALASLLMFVTLCVSVSMRLQLEKDIFVSSVRCVVQLAVLGLVLKRIFSSNDPVFIFSLSGVLGWIAAFEISRWRTRRQINGLLLISFVPVLASSLVIALVGGKYGMNFDPPYVASKFVPILGMLIGNTMTGMTLGIDSVLALLDTRRDAHEAMLCYGATRWELLQPVVAEAMRVALIPTITMVSITGLISFPGMMSGQVLGGADVVQASHYQQVVMFMLTASTALGVVMSTIAVAFAVVDESPMIHTGRITIQGSDAVPRKRIAAGTAGRPKCGDAVRHFRARFKKGHCLDIDA